MTAALEGDEWSAARPGRTLPPGKTRYPFYRRLGGPQGRSGWAENLVANGNRSRTVQPVAQSLYRLSHPTHKIKYIKTIKHITHCMLSAKYYMFRHITEISKNVSRSLIKRFSQNCEKLLLASLCLSVSPSVRRQQLGSHWTDFHEI